MFKFLIFCLTLWQGMYEITCRNENPRSTSFPQSSNDGGKNLTGNLGRQYNIHAGNIIINLNGRSLRPMGFSSFASSERKSNSGYIETIGIGAHKLHRRSLSWNKARKICTDEQGHLAVIRSDSEAKIILQMMHEMSIEDAWLGLHDQFAEGDWVTIMDEPLGETGWAKWTDIFLTNPDNFQGNQNCARLVKHAGGMDGMDDENCELAKSFVCKISNM